MPAPKLPTADFISIFEEIGPQKMARKFNLPVSSVFRRRAALERKTGRAIIAPGDNPGKIERIVPPTHPGRIEIDVPDGVVLVGSDAHIWPGPLTPAMRAFIRFAKDLKPKAVILNGDVMDCATISRHPPIGWESRPTVQQEIEAAQDVLHQIERACPRGTRRLWTLGNHDSRYETKIATVAPELAKVVGVHLRDHFPHWEPCWSVWVNQNMVVKHRLKSGIHAPHNNTMWAGRTLVSGHLHSAKVIPLTEYNGTRYGVDTGCLADPDAKAFVDYTEDGPKNWRSAFGVFTFRAGRLMQPELALAWDQDHVEFRGEIIAV